jgi:Fe-S cluster biogenesis protein NfuA
MFRILCDPSSGSTELSLTEITRSDSQIFCRVLGQCGVCVLSGRTVHTHHRFKITLPNADQAHDKISVNHHE